MEIIDCGAENCSAIKEFMELYDCEVGQQKISPKVKITDLSYSSIASDPWTRIIFAKRENDLAGIMKYRLNVPLPQSSLKFSGLYDIEEWQDSNERGRTAFIDSMETFPNRQGIGRMMMNALKNNTYIGKIYLVSRADAIGFYEKMGFGVSGDHGPNPLMSIRLL